MRSRCKVLKNNTKYVLHMLDKKKRRERRRRRKVRRKRSRNICVLSPLTNASRGRRRSAIRQRARWGTVNNFYDTLNSPPGIKRSSVGDELWSSPTLVYRLNECRSEIAGWVSALHRTDWETPAYSLYQRTHKCVSHCINTGAIYWSNVYIILTYYATAM